MFESVVAILLCYLIGSVPFGYLLVKHVFTSGEDIRRVGSGGTGATNVARRAGRAAGLLTYLLDCGKGAAAVFLMSAVAGENHAWVGAGGIAAVAGHSFPVFLGFRGGKGVATSAGVFLVLAPYSVIPALALWAAVVYFTRYVSLGSIVAAGSVPLWTLIIYGVIAPTPHLGFIVSAAVACFALILFQHRDNVNRLIRGTENKIGQRVGSVVPNGERDQSDMRRQEES